MRDGAFIAACGILDRWRKQSASDEWIESFCDLVIEWKPVGWAEEKGQISAGVGPMARTYELTRFSRFSRRTN